MSLRQNQFQEDAIMENKRFVYYQEEGMFIGWLEEYPDYRTQGESLEELKVNLKDIFQELTSGNIPLVYHVGELQVA
jgi:predicted RNase H-like HicB family nuclease